MKVMEVEDLKQYALVACYYNGNSYLSLPMILDDNTELTTTINRILLEGTDMLKAWKMPITEFSFLIFSRKQLDETLFEIGIYTGAELKALNNESYTTTEKKPKKSTTKNK